MSGFWSKVSLSWYPPKSYKKTDLFHCKIVFFVQSNKKELTKINISLYLTLITVTMSRQGQPRGRYVGGGYRGRGYSRRPHRGHYVPHDAPRPEPTLEEILRRELAKKQRQQPQAGPSRPGPSKPSQGGSSPPRKQARKRKHLEINDATNTGVSPAFHYAIEATHRSAPDWYAVCRMCGATKHMGKECPHEDDENGYGLACEYCDKTHNIHVCPALHHRCATCLKRGHMNRDCPKANPVRIRTNFDKFTKAAEKGLWTSHYKRNVGWGYFALPSWVQYDLLKRVTKRAYPKGQHSGDEYLTSDVDLYNHVVTALKELLVEERITKESDLDLRMKCSLAEALQTYYAVVKAYGVAVSQKVPLAAPIKPPRQFSDLLPLPPADEEELEEVYALPTAKPAAQREMFPEPPTGGPDAASEDIELSDEEAARINVSESEAEALLGYGVSDLTVSDKSESSRKGSSDME